MKRKTFRVILAAFLFFLFPASLVCAQQPDNNRVRIATWNIRMLSDGSRDPSEVTKIVNLIDEYDLVAIQEARDTRVLDRMKAKLPGWTYIASQKVGRGQKEIYAFFWRTSRVSRIGRPWTLMDRQDLFIREPFAATFRAGKFDFTLCTVHVLFGKSKSQRRKELVLMDEYVAAIQSANESEQDILLVGDFNFPPDDIGWQLAGWTPLFKAPMKTTIGDKSLYDNIWIDPEHTSEFTGEKGVNRFDQALYGNDLKKASLEVSDHRPVWAVFSTQEDDDVNEYGELSRAHVKVEAQENAGAAVPENKPASEQGKGGIAVYATPSGKKYHLKTCRYAKENASALTVAAARKKGLEPCKVCGPPK